MAGYLERFTHIIRWLGIISVYDTGRDAYLIILARCLRMFAYGTNSLVLALFFSALQFTDARIGLFMTLTLLGDVVLSILLTGIADKIGRRKVLFAGSFLMIFSGLVFAYFENFWVLLLAAVVGVISATGGDFGPFRSIEESVLSHLTTPETRPDVLSWYVTTSTLGSSIGSEVSGRLMHYLQGRDGWNEVDAYHALFWVYAAMGVVNALLTYLMSSACELQVSDKEAQSYAMVPEDEEEESDDEPESSTSSHPVALKTAPLRSGIFAYFTTRFAQISRPTLNVMWKLWALLALDSMADGMVPYSLTNLYLDKKFEISKATLGDITSVSYFLGAISTMFAGPLSRILGLVNTMVFTHIPSSAAVFLFPLPSSLPLTVLLLLIRTGLNNMDQAPRSALIAAVVKPEERTAVMGITNMLRTLAATAGPTVTGLLAGSNRFWIAFVSAGAFRLAYDFGLWAIFVNIRLDRYEGGGKTEMSKAQSLRKVKEVDEEEVDEIPK